MSDIEMTCGQCRHAKAVPAQPGQAVDFNQRVCFGAPPSPVLVPGPKGMQMIGVRPSVAVTERACGMFVSKFFENGILAREQ